MAISNFIPTVWSEKMLHALDKNYIGITNSNREFEGDIREKGNKVRICGLDAITIGNYFKNQDIDYPEELNDTYKELEIDQAKYFNFLIDDVDQAQCNPHLMDLAVQNAARALANVAERHLYSFVTDAAHLVENLTPSTDNIIDTLLDARTKLLKEDVVDPSDIVIEVAPEVAGMILKAKVALSTDNTDSLENGCIGNIGGCKIYVSSNISTIKDGSTKIAMCVARTRRALAFAEQLSEVEAYRPELRFADGMTGLHLYGVKVVYPNEMVAINIAIPNED